MFNVSKSKGEFGQKVTVEFHDFGGKLEISQNKAKNGLEIRRFDDRGERLFFAVAENAPKLAEMFAEVSDGKGGRQAEAAMLTQLGQTGAELGGWVRSRTPELQENAPIQAPAVVPSVPAAMPTEDPLRDDRKL